jgi:hypothetical protein
MTLQFESPLSSQQSSDLMVRGEKSCERRMKKRFKGCSANSNNNNSSSSNRVRHELNVTAVWTELTFIASDPEHLLSGGIQPFLSSKELLDDDSDTDGSSGSLDSSSGDDSASGPAWKAKKTLRRCVIQASDESVAILNCSQLCS